MKAATEIINSQTSGDSLICGPDELEITDEIINAVALALDQREQSVWEEALKAVPEKECAHLLQPGAVCASCFAHAFARQSLLSARSKSLKE